MIETGGGIVLPLPQSSKHEHEYDQTVETAVQGRSDEKAVIEWLRFSLAANDDGAQLLAKVVSSIVDSRALKYARKHRSLQGFSRHGHVQQQQQQLPLLSQ